MRLRHDSIFSVNVFAAHIDEWKQKKKEILSLVDFNNKDFAVMCGKTGLSKGAESWYYISNDRCKN